VVKGIRKDRVIRDDAGRGNREAEKLNPFLLSFGHVHQLPLIRQTQQPSSEAGQMLLNSFESKRVSPVGNETIPALKINAKTLAFIRVCCL